ASARPARRARRRAPAAPSRRSPRRRRGSCRGDAAADPPGVDERSRRRDLRVAPPRRSMGSRGAGPNDAGPRREGLLASHLWRRATASALKDRRRVFDTRPAARRPRAPTGGPMLRYRADLRTIGFMAVYYGLTALLFAQHATGAALPLAAIVPL